MYETTGTISAPPERRRLVFAGEGAELFGVYLKNLIFTILTLGIYHFWGKTRVRQYLVGQTLLEKDRFAYHGTPQELIRGFARGFAVFGGVWLLFNAVEMLGLDAMMHFLLLLPLYAVLFALISAATVGARRYYLSRISWRGIRFSFRGQIVDFLKLSFRDGFLTFVTLGVYYPWHQVNKHRFLVANAFFGNRRFAFRGDGRDLVGSFLLAMVLTPFTLGLSQLWYSAYVKRYLWNGTTFGQTRFECNITGGGLFVLHLLNGLMVFATLGLAFPWAMVRTLEFSLDHVALTGPLDLEGIRQETVTAGATGDALSDVLGLDTDIGLT